jgi:hypothetical protein
MAIDIETTAMNVSETALCALFVAIVHCTSCIVFSVHFRLSLKQSQMLDNSIAG